MKGKADRMLSNQNALRVLPQAHLENMSQQGRIYLVFCPVAKYNHFVLFALLQIHVLTAVLVLMLLP